ncbi:putative membrane protein [Vibrio parahaemolyticus VPTS-2010_2]|nr:putative membrane protein [Vibrio parahaemolyticus VPTS-2010_2]
MLPISLKLTVTAMLCTWCPVWLASCAMTWMLCTLTKLV